jgi:hypothetical protein
MREQFPAAIVANGCGETGSSHPEVTGAEATGVPQFAQNL